MRPRAAAALATLALAACASVEDNPAPEPQKPIAATHPAPVVAVVPPVVKPAPPPNVDRTPPPATARPSEMDTLLTEFERLRRVSPADLAREQEAARLAHVQLKSDATRVRLAMALSVPGSPPAEEQRALELLDPLIKNPASPLHGLAFLLSSYIQDQRRLVAQLQGSQQANQTLTQNNQALQQNLHGLQQKLDALRTLERSLTERGEPTTPRRR